MRRPSQILFPLAFVLFAFAIGVYVGASAVANALSRGGYEGDPRILVALAGIRYSQLSLAAQEITVLASIIALIAYYARSRCESEEKVRWKRLVVFAAVTTVIVWGGVSAWYYFFELPHLVGQYGI